MKALVVEDETNVAEGVRRCLAAEGFEVTVASDGRRGLALALAEEYGLIILDIIVPYLNGFLFCQRLRAEGNHTPVLMLTAKNGEFDIVEGLESGADDFLIKPFSMIVLLARVKALLRRPERRVEWDAVAGLRLDPLGRRCYRGSESIQLTPREMEVLAQFLDRPGQVISRVELLASVWGPGFTGDPNIVDVYVSHLRRKLEDPFDEANIETVRGEGYRLTDRADGRRRDAEHERRSIS